jgi:hypothetical protein
MLTPKTLKMKKYVWVGKQNIMVGTILFFAGFLFQNDCLGQMNALPPLPELIKMHDEEMARQKRAEERSKKMWDDVMKKDFLDNITTDGSWDVVKMKEGGYSAARYNGKSGLNVSIFTAEAIAFYLNTSDVDIEGYDNKKLAYGGSLVIAEGLQFIQKGAKDQGDNGKTTLNYLELLGDAVYQYNLENYAGSLFAGAGPYFGYGLGGKFSGAGISAPAFGGNGGYKRFDFGLQVMAGYAFPTGVNIRLGYEYGLSNKAPGGSDFTSRNRAFSVNAGYNIGRLFRK